MVLKKKAQELSPSKSENTNIAQVFSQVNNFLKKGSQSMQKKDEPFFITLKPSQKSMESPFRGLPLAYPKTVFGKPGNPSLDKINKECEDTSRLTPLPGKGGYEGKSGEAWQGFLKQTLFNKFFICCKESRIESPNSFYGCFYIGPFDESLSQTLALNIRRTLLSELTGLAITAVEIDGVLHKFSSLPGVQETVLDIICNLQNLAFKKVLNNTDFQAQRVWPNSPLPLWEKKGGGVILNQVAYLRERGPRVIKASDIILPAGIQCVNPDQYIATLAEDGVLSMKIYLNEGKSFLKQKQKNLDLAEIKQRNRIQKFQPNQAGLSPSSSFKPLKAGAVGTSLPFTSFKSNKLFLDSVFMPVTKVNTMVQSNEKLTDLGLAGKSLPVSCQASKEAWPTKGEWAYPLELEGLALPPNSLDKPLKPRAVDPDLPFVLLSNNNLNQIKQTRQCHIVFEIWTNGSLHPREALMHCLEFLATTFVTLENVKVLGSMFKSDITYGKLFSKYTNLVKNS